MPLTPGTLWLCVILSSFCPWVTATHAACPATSHRVYEGTKNWECCQHCPGGTHECQIDCFCACAYDSSAATFCPQPLVADGFGMRGAHPSYRVGYAFDNEVDSWSMWRDYAPDVVTRASWVSCRFAASVTATEYSVTSASGAPESDPANWQLLGGWEGSIVLDTRASVTFSARNQMQEFIIANPGAHTVYTFDVSSVKGPNPAFIQIAEIGIKCSPSPAPTQAPTTAPAGILR